MNPNPNMSDMERDLLDVLQPDTYEAAEAWQPTTIDEVDWCAQKAAEADREYREAVAAANRQREKIDAWLADAKTKRDDRVNFFEMHAVGFLQRHRQAELDRGVKPEKLTKTLKLASGSVQARQGWDTFNVTDEAAAIKWAEANDSPVLVVKRSVSKTEIARHVKATGEMPDGVEIVPGEVKLSLNFGAKS